MFAPARAGREAIDDAARSSTTRSEALGGHPAARARHPRLVPPRRRRRRQRRGRRPDDDQGADQGDGRQPEHRRPAAAPPRRSRTRSIRGPQELHTLSRAVTARDFELAAERASGAVARAKAVTQAELWRYATPGHRRGVPRAEPARRCRLERRPDGSRAVSRGAARRARDAARPDRVRADSTSADRWARPASSTGSATRPSTSAPRSSSIARRTRPRSSAASTSACMPRSTRCRRALNAGGWPFGQSLYASSVYKIILSEPGVRYARGVQLVVDEVPNEAVRDARRRPVPGTHLVRGRRLGPVPVAQRRRRLGGDDALRGRDRHAHRGAPGAAGLVAVVTLIADTTARASRCPRDSGATWTAGDPTGVRIEDIAWMDRDGEPILLLATDVGLYQLPITARRRPRPDPRRRRPNQDMGFYAVAVSRGGARRGQRRGRGAARSKGVYLSSEGGRSGTFRNIGLAGHDVRALAVQRDGPNRFLWAGIATHAATRRARAPIPGSSSAREDPVEGWRAWSRAGRAAAASTSPSSRARSSPSSHQSGVPALDTGRPNAVVAEAGRRQRPAAARHQPLPPGRHRRRRRHPTGGCGHGRRDQGRPPQHRRRRDLRRPVAARVRRGGHHPADVADGQRPERRSRSRRAMDSAAIATAPAGRLPVGAPSGRGRRRRAGPPAGGLARAPWSRSTARSRTSSTACTTTSTRARRRRRFVPVPRGLGRPRLAARWRRPTSRPRPPTPLASGMGTLCASWSRRRSRWRAGAAPRGASCASSTRRPGSRASRSRRTSPATTDPRARSTSGSSLRQAAEDYRPLIERVIVAEKPAYATYELVFVTGPGRARVAERKGGSL